MSSVRVRRSVVGSGNVLDWVLEQKVAGADLSMARVCAERRLRPLLAASIGVDVCVDVCSAHCVGGVRF